MPHVVRFLGTIYGSGAADGFYVDFDKHDTYEALSVGKATTTRRFVASTPRRARPSLTNGSSGVAYLVYPDIWDTPDGAYGS